MRRGAFRIAAVALAAVLLLGCGSAEVREEPKPPAAGPGNLVDPGVKPGVVPKPLPGHVAPDITFQDVFSKERITLRSLRGQVILLNFWATWCLPCRVEMPDLEAFQHEMKGKVRVIALGADPRETPEKLGAFARDLGLTFTIAYDGSAAAEAYQVTGIPTSFVIDTEGLVRARRPGQITAQQMRDLTADALKSAQK